MVEINVDMFYSNRAYTRLSPVLSFKPWKMLIWLEKKRR